VLQCVVVCYEAPHLEFVMHGVTRRVGCSVLQRVAVCCSVLQCVAVCCSLMQCVAVRYEAPPLELVMHDFTHYI